MYADWLVGGVAAIERMRNEDPVTYVKTVASILPKELKSDGTEGNGQSEGPSISADGSYAAYFSCASNLVEGDTNLRPDVFVVSHMLFCLRDGFHHRS